MPPTVSNKPAPLPAVLPALPKSWSELSWRQLCAVWQCKLRYGGNADVARAAELLALLGLETAVETEGRNNGITALRYDERTGEAVYTLRDGDGRRWAVTPRELSQLARQTMKWFDYPYGDPGKEAVRDEKGKVVEEAVEPVRGYVNTEWRDAMQLPEETLVVCGDRILTGSEWQGLADAERDKILHSSLFTHHFKLPEVTLRDITWQQYRTLQSLAPLLFQEGASDDDILSLQAQFLAHSLVPAAPDGRTVGHTALPDRFAPQHSFYYDADRAEQTVGFWLDKLKIENGTLKINGHGKGRRDSTEAQAQSSMFNVQCSILFHILFQVYQTAMRYYEVVFPLLFNGGGKSDPLQDALTGETRTLNAVMKYQGYTKPEDVYAENLPIILSTLNTMAEEAKQIEQMNARIKSRK